MQRITSTLLGSGLLAGLGLLAACDAGPPDAVGATTEDAIINGTVISAQGSGFINFGNCSGTLLRNDWVVSARHCFSEKKINNPGSVTATMGTQSSTARRIIVHPSFDVAMVQLKQPLAMSRSTSGYVMPLYDGATSALKDKSLNCYGYGRNTYTSGFGTLRTAILKVKSTSQDKYVLDKNSSGQIKWKGDSGGSCIYNTPGGSQVVTGVANSCWHSSRAQTVSQCDDMASSTFHPWAEALMAMDGLGGASASGDFDGDGFDDLAVGAPGEAGSGRVLVYRGTPSGVTSWTTLDQSGIGANEDGDRFGAALAAGDFDGDGRDDLAVGAPGEGPGSKSISGYVNLYRGTASGLVQWTGLSQAGLGLDEAGDEFGAALAAGDLNGDGKVDLVVGAPGEAPGAGEKSGVVFVFSGAVGSGVQAWLLLTEAPMGVNEKRDRFGHALTTGDFDGDGITDLAVGAPGEAAGGGDVAGAVYVYHGTPAGPIAWSWSNQDGLGGNEQGDLFGWALAAGDFNGDGDDDLVVGAPGEAPNSDPRAGGLFVFAGGSQGLLPWTAFNQELGALGTNELGDWYASALSVGDLDQDGRADLVVGAPGEAKGGGPESGWVYVYRGTPTGLIAWQSRGQSPMGVNEAGDWFGGSLVTGDFNADGNADLAVGAPGEIPGASSDAGYVFTFAGSADGLQAWKGIGK